VVAAAVVVTLGGVSSVDVVGRGQYIQVYEHM